MKIYSGLVRNESIFKGIFLLIHWVFLIIKKTGAKETTCNLTCHGRLKTVKWSWRCWYDKIKTQFISGIIQEATKDQ